MPVIKVTVIRCTRHTLKEQWYNAMYYLSIAFLLIVSLLNPLTLLVCSAVMTANTLDQILCWVAWSFQPQIKFCLNPAHKSFGRFKIQVVLVSVIIVHILCRPCSTRINVKYTFWTSSRKVEHCGSRVIGQISWQLETLKTKLFLSQLLLLQNLKTYYPFKETLKTKLFLSQLSLLQHLKTLYPLN